MYCTGKLSLSLDNFESQKICTICCSQGQYHRVSCIFLALLITKAPWIRCKIDIVINEVRCISSTILKGIIQHIYHKEYLSNNEKIHYFSTMKK